jgi:hypothetical protein
MKKSDFKILQEFEAHCELVQLGTSALINKTETLSEREKRKDKALKNYDFFFEYYFPHFCDNGKSKVSKFQKKAAKIVAENSILLLFLVWFRGAAKSTHANIGIPLWLMLRGEMKFMVLMGFNLRKAKILLSDIQAEIQYNALIINDFGTMYNHGTWAEGSFKTSTGVAFQAIGLLQDPSGFRNGQYRPDYIVVDDVDNPKKARNKVIVKEAVKNILEALRESMSKDTARLVIANNRKVKDGILDTLIRDTKGQNNRHIIEVNAVTDEETFTPTWSERYTAEYWKNKRASTTFRGWKREYMNTPIEDGNIFKAEWLQVTKIKPLTQYSDIVVYGDLSYTTKGDYKAFVVIGKIGRDFHLIDCFVQQCSIGAAARWLYDLYEKGFNKLSSVRYYYEGNMIQKQMFRDEFDSIGDERGYYVPIVADMRSKGNKFDRIEKMSAFFERLNFFVNDEIVKSSNYSNYQDQILAFEKGSGANDDAPDATEGAIWFLNNIQNAGSRSYSIIEKVKSRHR